MKKIIPLFIIWISAISIYSQESYEFSFQNPELPTVERIEDLISRLTLEEKASLMLYNSPAVDRLGISEYNWWSECLHGVGRAGKATVFPQAIGMAATFDEELIYEVASAISDEARAKHHEAVRKGNRGQYMGLSFWTPNINIFRDPRWGRGQETYGEDPYLTSIIGAAFVKGLQGDHPKYLKTSACAKHYVVHSGPEKGRHHFNAIPDERDFRETYLPGFQYLVEKAKVEAVMCAYNRTYDKPCCGKAIFETEAGVPREYFEGHIVSDCWALDDIWARHKVVEERVEAAAMAAKAGVNLNCGYIYKYLPKAVDTGLINEKIVDGVLKTLLKTRFKLGLFDPVEMNPYAKISTDVVNCEKHKQLAYSAASKSIVLLKNKNNVLPLDKNTLKSLFIAGPTSNDVNSLMGNYNGFSGELVTFLEGIIDRVDVGTTVEHSQGFMFHNDSSFHGQWQANRAEAVVVCLGINYLYEGEEGDAMLNTNGGDRLKIELPDNQLQYVKMMREKIGDKPLIVLVTGGSAMAIPEIDELADAILFAWYPGEQGGNALADILFGDVNPSGRLPVTFYKSTDDLPPFEEYSMKGRTYKYFDGEALYPFGYGLSYSTFEYSDLYVNQNADKFELTVNIHNSSELAGEEVVQVYAKQIDPNVSQPIKKLIGFKRVNLKKGESKAIEIIIDSVWLKYWDVEKQEYLIEKGEYEIQVGSSSEDIKIKELLRL